MNPSREPHIVQVRGYFRIDVYERPVQLTLGALGLEAQRELLIKGEDVVVTTPTEDFVTILKGGVQNPAVQRALQYEAG